LFLLWPCPPAALGPQLEAEAMWWGAAQETPKRKATDDAPAQGAPAVNLLVNVEASARPASAVLGEGIRTLYEKGELCDLVFLAGGERFPAHGAVVAAVSSSFGKFLLRLSSDAQEGSEDPMEGLLSVAVPASAAGAAEPAPPASGGPEPVPAGAAAAEPTAEGQVLPATTTAAGEQQREGDGGGAGPAAAAPSGACQRWPRPVELQVNGIEAPEAMRLALSYVYDVGTGAAWEYQPSGTEVNKDVLRLARHFGLSHLHEHAARWLARGLNTRNVVDRLVTCEEFGLNRLREKIIEQLTANPTELAVVSSSAEIMRHPRILQDLLVQVASLCGVGEKADKPGKKGQQQASQDKPAAVATAPEKLEKPEKPSAEKPPAKRAKRGAAGA